MLRTLRSRGFALATLAAFLVGQPVALCSAVCFFERHHAAAHPMPDMARGGQALATSTCHTTTAGSVQRDPFSVLSPMAPTRASAIAVAFPRSVEPASTHLAWPRQIFQTVESPPPRLV